MDGNWEFVFIVNVMRFVKVVMVMVIFVLDIICCIVVGMFNVWFWWFKWLSMMNMLLSLIFIMRKGRIFIMWMKGVCIIMDRENLVKILRLIENVLFKVIKECLVSGFWNNFLIIMLVNCNMSVNVREN